MLDTNVLIYLIKPQPPAIAQRVDALPEDARLCTPIGANDLWIACHALDEGATLVTHNTHEFLRVGGLKVEDWVAPA